MARKTRSVLWADANAKFTGSGNKWEGQELDDTIADLKDSLAFEDEKATLGSNTYDCATRNLWERTLTSDGALTISGAEPGRYYTLIIKGNFTLSLPSGHYQNGGATVPASTNPRILTFLYDGTNYFFSHAIYSAT